ncbi:hypothetical protein [Streptomyces sp. NPDC005435]|uniref:hypothetical protein n=1 Tax=Streptomyces sp. NPDC005435 TaxID=3154464 RepID=UPI0034515F9B
MVETLRYFTVAQLAALCVPPDDPDRIELQEHILTDEHMDRRPAAATVTGPSRRLERASGRLARFYRSATRSR